MSGLRKALWRALQGMLAQRGVGLNRNFGWVARGGRNVPLTHVSEADKKKVISGPRFAAQGDSAGFAVSPRSLAVPSRLPTFGPRVAHNDEGGRSAQGAGAEGRDRSADLTITSRILNTYTNLH